MDLLYMLEILPEFLSLLHVTIIILALSAIFGLFFSIIVTTIRIKEIKILNQIMSMYISFARSVPIILILFQVYYGIPVLLSLIGINATNISEGVAAVIALTFYNAGYLSEVLRPAYLAIDRGQHEAAESLGYTSFQKFTRIIVPQVVPIALPGWGNALVYLVHDTSLIFTIGVFDMMGQAELLISSNYGSNQIEIYFTVALLFCLVVFLSDMMIRFFERKTKSFRLGSGINVKAKQKVSAQRVE